MEMEETNAEVVTVAKVESAGTANAEPIDYSKGINTGMTGNVVNMVLQSIILTCYGLFDLLNAFPTIGLVFAIIAAVNSKKPNKRELALRFAARAKLMSVWGTILNAVSFFIWVICIAACLAG